MSPPDTDKQNGPQGGTPETRNEKFDTDQAQALSSVRVARRTVKRSLPGQLPVVLMAKVHEPRPGRKTAAMLPEDPNCPVCGYQREHRAEWPPPALLTKRCPGCRYCCEFMTRKVLAKRRRAA